MTAQPPNLVVSAASAEQQDGEPHTCRGCQSANSLHSSAGGTILHRSALAAMCNDVEDIDRDPDNDFAVARWSAAFSLIFSGMDVWLLVTKMHEAQHFMSCSGTGHLAPLKDDPRSAVPQVESALIHAFLARCIWQQCPVSMTSTARCMCHALCELSRPCEGCQPRFVLRYCARMAGWLLLASLQAVMACSTSAATLSRNSAITMHLTAGINSLELPLTSHPDRGRPQRASLRLRRPRQYLPE
jgi:hypothetical protein